MHDRCWARCLGNCKGPISGEHLISVGAFRPGIGKSDNRAGRIGERLTVTLRELDGTKSVKDTTVRRYTEDILCEHHNNVTADLDKAGSELIDAIWDFLEKHDRRKPLANLRWNVERYLVDSALVERWLMKIAVNNLFGQPFPIGGSGAAPGWPTPELVEMIFGVRPVPHDLGTGLFHVLLEGPKPDLGERFDLALLERGGIAGGMLLAHRTFLFGVNLEARSFPPQALAAMSRSLRDAMIVRPMKSMRIEGTNVELVFS